MIRVAIVGMGGMGWFHASRYFQIPGVKLVAIADIRPDRLEAKNAVQINIENKASLPDLAGVQRFEGGDALIAEAQDVDVIDICLPSFMHADFTVRALQSGRHVLCEKPMALNTADADRMIATARAAGRKLMIAQCIRFWPEYQFLKQTMSAGALGRLLSLNLLRIGGCPTGWGWEDWFMDPARSGGTLYDLHIHDVDFVNSLLGVPDRVMASGRQAAPGSAIEAIQTVFGYAHGPQVSIQAGWSEVQIPFKAGYEAWFDKGFLRFDPGAATPLVIYDDARRLHEVTAACPPGDAYLNEIQYFLNCVQQDQEPVECPPESARDSLVLLDRIRDAIQQEEHK
jgi:predicted dehydrogenase